MKRWGWLLVMPYMVVASSDVPHWWALKHAGTEKPFIFKDKEIADDLATALNEAHEKRKNDCDLCHRYHLKVPECKEACQ